MKRHLSFKERLDYVQAMQDDTLESLPDEVYNHVQSCDNCYEVVSELYELEPVMVGDPLNTTQINRIKQRLKQKAIPYASNRGYLDYRVKTTKERSRKSELLEILEPEEEELYLSDDQEVTFELAHKAEQAHLFVFNEKGEQIDDLITTKKTYLKFNITELDSGIYYWTVGVKDDSLTGKFYVCQTKDISTLIQPS